MISEANSDRSILEKSIEANSSGVNPEQFGLSGLPHPLPICARPCSLMMRARRLL